MVPTANSHERTAVGGGAVRSCESKAKPRGAPRAPLRHRSELSPRQACGQVRPAAPRVRHRRAVARRATRRGRRRATPKARCACSTHATAAKHGAKAASRPAPLKKWKAAVAACAGPRKTTAAKCAPLALRLGVCTLAPKTGVAICWLAIGRARRSRICRLARRGPCRSRGRIPPQNRSAPRSLRRACASLSWLGREAAVLSGRPAWAARACVGVFRPRLAVRSRRESRTCAGCSTPKPKRRRIARMWGPQRKRAASRRPGSPTNNSVRAAVAGSLLRQFGPHRSR